MQFTGRTILQCMKAIVGSENIGTKNGIEFRGFTRAWFPTSAFVVKHFVEKYQSENVDHPVTYKGIFQFVSPQLDTLTATLTGGIADG